MNAVLEIEDNKASFVMELLSNFSFVKVQSYTNSETILFNNRKEKETISAPVRAKLSDKYRGIMTREQGLDLKRHINEMRNEWDNI